MRWNQRLRTAISTGMENSYLNNTFERIDAHWLDTHPDVKVIGSPTTGLDHIDLVLCQERGVKVVSLQGELSFLRSITSTAEHTWGLIIALSRCYRSAFDGVRRQGNRLSGKTLGIIGSRGRIGTQVAKYAKAFGMKIKKADKGDKLVGLLRESDVVTAHIPLQGNEGFWKLAHFKQMKPSAVFINTSRTRIVEDGALLSALRDGLIAGAAMDFTDDPELVQYAKTHDNLILTPHIGGNTVEDRAATDLFIQEKMQKALYGI